MIRRPMKGAALNEQMMQLITLPYPFMVFPKIDGFRCILDKHPMTSRLSRFPNEHFHSSLQNVLPVGSTLDSEVVVGEKRGSGVLQRTSSGVTSERGKPDFHLWVFDHVPTNLHMPFISRYEEAKKIIEALDHPRIHALKFRWAHDRDELEQLIDRALRLGYEGVILRHPDAPYKEGKATISQGWMLKIKPFETAEGRITGWYEEQQNTNEAKREVTGKLKRSSAKAGKVAKGTLGGLILRDVRTNVEVRVGGGYSADQRKMLWALIQRDPNLLLGKLVRYKKQAVGEKDKPRHPNFVEFVDFRPEWDMTDD